MNSRKLHRGTMTVFTVLILYWVLSGLTIAVFDATDPHQAWAGLGGGPGALLHPHGATARAVPDPQSLAFGLAKAIASADHLSTAAVDYEMAGDIPRLQLSEASGERTSEMRFYAATGETMTPRVADGDPFRPGPPESELRERLKSFHKGDAFGLAGQALGLLAGSVVIVMTVTGFLVYQQLWSVRKKTGRPSFFWKSRESRWRRWHRCIALVAAVFILNKAITGTILAWGEIQIKLAVTYHLLPFPYPMPTPLPPYSESRLQGDLLHALETSYAAARAVAPDAPIVAIELVRRSGQSKGLVTLGGAQSRTLAFDMDTGAPAEDWSRTGVQKGNGYSADWHQILKRMHRGDIIGRFSGRYADIVVGLALLYLVLSGIVMYFDMFSRRAHVGRKGLFWN